ncbi:hypothetical protein VTI74DRAFT_5519 [Chaetomium olivicolor]
MARLNEPPVPADSHLEILRRKFLRQNRDIAKINSDQSQKIRRLENDCARLLSENLELRGQILRLQKRIEDDNAQRIADHALEVKAKLEAQLSEFAALLGSLGVEPPSKRHAPEDRRLSKPRSSLARSPPQRRRRTVDLEALAEQEGRLPPIYENKTYPRATMNSEEIMALCAAAADTSESPDLGPPPVSRYVDEDPVKYDSPSRAEVIPESPRRSFALSPPKLDYDRKPSRSPEPTKESRDAAVDGTPSKGTASARTPAPPPAPQPIRAGTKRKHGDENAIFQSATAQKGKDNAIVNDVEKTFPTRGGQKRRSVKDLPTAGRGKIGGPRTPLAAKSTNQDVSSPLKVMKDAPLKEGKKEQARTAKDLLTKADSTTQKPLPVIEIPPPEPAAVTAAMIDSVTALPSAAPSSPSTPDRPTQKEIAHDTPPPADISSTGETSRPSRRARAAISYAEPNLRDKMRRPTKELFDAVSGEGKFHRATTATKADDHSAPTSSTKARSEPGSSTGGGSRTLSVGDPSTKTQQNAFLSPLAQKDVFPEALPSTVVMERRKRPSSVGVSQESLASMERLEPASEESAPTTSEHHLTAAQTTTSSRHKLAAPSTDKNRDQRQPREVDIYDFAASSPSSAPNPLSSTTTATCSTTSSSAPTITSSSTAHPTVTNNNPPTTTTTTTTRTRTARKSSMAAAAALRELLDEEEQDAKSHAPPANKPRSAAHSRKRASMLAPKKGSMLMDLDEEEGVANTSGLSSSSGEGDETSTGMGRAERVARRRSMML